MKKQIQLTDISGKAHYIPLNRTTPTDLNANPTETRFDNLTVLEYRLMRLYAKDYNGLYTSYSCRELAKELKRPMNKIRHVIGKLEKRGWLEGNERYPIFYHIPLKSKVYNLNITNREAEVTAQETEVKV
jgi:hypothetical protein